MNKVAVAIIGAGPYGLSLAAHFSARNINHRIFGKPMQFWSNVAVAAGERYLKSYCFGTSLSTPQEGFRFGDFNGPRGLETFEPCSISNFADYGRWFQENQVPWVEPVDVSNVEQTANGFALTLSNGEQLQADNVVVATGLSYFASVPRMLSSLPEHLVTHTSGVKSFKSYEGRSVAVIGAGQSALEAGALLFEAGAKPELLVREDKVIWHHRVGRNRSLWRRLRSPIAGLGSGPIAWALTNFPGATRRIPTGLRTRMVKRHLPAEGAWWLRERVEGKVPIHLTSEVVEARELNGRVSLKVRDNATGELRQVEVDHVIAGSGYNIDVERIGFLAPELRAKIERLERSPRLDNRFESSVRGLSFVGPTSAMSFGPLFRFVVGADYTAKTVTNNLAKRVRHGAGERVASKASSLHAIGATAAVDTSAAHD
jgi:FAD-dependent urate hydroxylase